MGKWDYKTSQEGMHKQIPPIDPLNNNVEEPHNRWGAFLFLLWSLAMMGIGFLIALYVNGHIVFR